MSNEVDKGADIPEEREDGYSDVKELIKNTRLTIYISS